MKLVVIAFVLLFMACSDNMSEVELHDAGKVEVSNGVFIKRISMSSGDRVYILVDSNDKLLGSGVSTSITVTRQCGKTMQSHTESNALLYK
jgi:hypothetical protein